MSALVNLLTTSSRTVIPGSTTTVDYTPKTGFQSTTTQGGVPTIVVSKDHPVVQKVAQAIQKHQSSSPSSTGNLNVGSGKSAVVGNTNANYNAINTAAGSNIKVVGGIDTNTHINDMHIKGKSQFGSGLILLI